MQCFKSKIVNANLTTKFFGVKNTQNVMDGYWIESLITFDREVPNLRSSSFNTDVTTLKKGEFVDGTLTLAFVCKLINIDENIL